LTRALISGRPLLLDLPGKLRSKVLNTVRIVQWIQPASERKTVEIKRRAMKRRRNEMAGDETP
jgi:hypothetical protein